MPLPKTISEVLRRTPHLRAVPFPPGSWPEVTIAADSPPWAEATYPANVPVRPPIVATAQVWLMFITDRLGVCSDHDGMPHALLSEYRRTDDGYQLISR